MLNGITDVTTLPWATPAYPIWTGSGNGIGYFAVPEIGSMVYVFFLEGDINQPVYFAEAPDALKGLPSSRTTNYPKRKISRTANGIEIMVDDTAKQIKVTHPTGTYILIDGDGTVTVSSQRDVNVDGANINITGSNTVNVNPS